MFICGTIAREACDQLSPMTKVKMLNPKFLPFPLKDIEGEKFIVHSILYPKNLWIISYSFVDEPFKAYGREMPKSGQGHRAGSSKKSQPLVNPAEDSSYIVFGDAKPKKKRPESPRPSGGDGSNGAGPGEDAPKKPDTRTLIGGASWTGKLPVNMLAEHCQKQKWQKPEYTMVYSCSLGIPVEKY